MLSSIEVIFSGGHFPCFKILKIVLGGRLPLAGQAAGGFERVCYPFPSDFPLNEINLLLLLLLL